MSWTLVSKKETTARKDYVCEDCKKDIPAGSFKKTFTFKKEDQYVSKGVCQPCEKYYRTRDLKI